MTTIPPEWLPPREYLPERIFPLPEVRLPRRLNLTERYLDRLLDRGFGDKTAVLHGSRRTSFAELRAEANRVANALRALGIEKNDRVLVRSGNSREFLATCYGAWRIGAIPVLVNPLLRAEEIAFRANDSAAKALVASADAYAEVGRARNDMPTVRHVVVVGGRVEDTLPWDTVIGAQKDEADTAPTSRDDFMRIIYSSGTTGRPKGVITTIGDAAAIAEVATRYLLDLSPNDILGGHPSFTFAFGFGFVLFLGHTGCTLSIVDRFEPALMFETVQAHRITVLCCVPTAFRMMLGVPDAERRYDTRSLRLCQSAGEWLPGATAREWKARFGVEILDAVGSADLNYWLATRPGTPDGKLDSSGLPLPGVECKIVDEDFNEVPPGTPGELVVRAPWGQQYWRRPDKQREGVARGWNRSGLIYVEDEDGYFWHKGRADEMIVSAGYKIPGGEVEATLLVHPAVLETAVVGVADPVRGVVVKAFVVLKPGHAPSASLAEELKQFVKERLEPYKYPREIEFVDGAALPRTVTGKIQRFALRERMPRA